MKARKALVVAAALAGGAAVVPTMVALRMMADNNNNGEVFGATGHLDVAYILKVSAVFYGVSFLLIFAVIFGLMRLWSSDAP